MLFKIWAIVSVLLLLPPGNEFIAAGSSGINFGTANNVCLSPPVLSGTLSAVEFRDTSRLRIVLKANLRSALASGPVRDVADLGTVIKREENLLHPVGMQFFFSERKILPDGYFSVMCRVWDLPDSSPRTYYAVFSLDKWEEGGTDILVHKEDHVLRIPGNEESGKVPPRKAISSVREGSGALGKASTGKNIPEGISGDEVSGKRIKKPPREKNAVNLILEAFSSIADSEIRPFTARAQKVFARVCELEKLRHDERIPMVQDEYYLVLYAKVYGPNKFDDVSFFMRYIAEERGEVGHDFSQSIIRDKKFLELYFLARLMDGKGPVLSRIARRPFFEFHADQLFGYYQGHRNLREIYGAKGEEHIPEIRVKVFRRALYLIHWLNLKGDHEAAKRAAKMLVELNIAEREMLLSGRREPDASEEEFMENLRAKILDENKMLRDDKELIKEAVQAAKERGYYASSLPVLKERVKTGHEKGMLSYLKDVIEGKQISSGPWDEEKAERAAKMADTARDAGLRIPTHPDTRYRLLVTSEFFAGGELRRHRADYGDRFDIESVSASNDEQFTEKVIRLSRGQEKRSVALVPDTLTQDQLRRIAGAGIKIVRTDVHTLLKARYDSREERSSFQVDTYAIMLLVRKIDENTPENSPLYELLNFYVGRLFSFDGEIDIKDYLQGLAFNRVVVLLRGVLAYHRAEPFRVPEYEIVSATLISA